jgi:acyl-coenzyme A thioesterase PaaI-like protein
LKFVQDFIGKQFTGSPSPYGHWLYGKVVSTNEKSVELEFTVRKEMTNPVGMLYVRHAF